jgi:hypothetical protein
MRRKRKLSKWERDARKQEEKKIASLKAANRALIDVVPFIPEYGQQKDTVIKAHNLIAGLVARYKPKR